MLWLLLASLKTASDAFASPLLIIFTPTFENLTRFLEQGDLLSAYRNSIVVVVATTILSFSAFSYLEVGKGATVAMVMLLIIFVVSLAILRNIQKTD